MSLATSQISDLVNRFKPVSMTEMPRHVTDSTVFNHPALDNAFHDIDLPGGRTLRQQTTIADANHGKFSYAFLDADSLERYTGSYRVVTKDCEAAVAGDLSIPERYFNSQGVIYVKGTLYCYCAWEFHKAMCHQSEHNASLSLSALTPRQGVTERDSSGNALATVHHTKLDAQFVETGEKTTKKKG